MIKSTLRFVTGSALAFALTASLAGCSGSDAEQTSSAPSSETQAAETSSQATATQPAAADSAPTQAAPEASRARRKLPPISSIQ